MRWVMPTNNTYHHIQTLKHHKSYSIPVAERRPVEDMLAEEHSPVAVDSFAEEARHTA